MNIQQTLDLLLEAWIRTMNKSIQLGTISEHWRESHIRVQYKDRGKKNDPNSNRGIKNRS